MVQNPLFHKYRKPLLLSNKVLFLSSLIPGPIYVISTQEPRNPCLISKCPMAPFDAHVAFRTCSRWRRGNWAEKSSCQRVPRSLLQFYKAESKAREEENTCMCVLKGKGETVYNAKGKHHLVWMWKLCSTASHRCDKVSFGAQDGQKAMKARGRIGKAVKLFSWHWKKPEEMKGQITELFAYMAFVRRSSKLTPTSQLYLNSGVSLLKPKQNNSKE